MAREDLRKKVDLAFLAAFYGGMLTENQRRVLSLHCEEDHSLGEIAEEVGISRQAVHEALTRAAAKLAEWESALGMAARFRRMEAGLEEALSALKSVPGVTDVQNKAVETVTPPAADISVLTEIRIQPVEK